MSRFGVTTTSKSKFDRRDLGACILNDRNRGALDWRFGMIAFGSQNDVVIVDAQSYAVVQVLTHHSEDITAVKFQTSYPSEQPNNKRNVYLATGDNCGSIILWDYFINSPLITFNFAYNLPVKCIQWHQTINTTILALFPNGTICFLDITTGQTIRTVEYDVIKNSFYFEQNPFDCSEFCVCTPEEVFLLSIKKVAGYEIFNCPSFSKSSIIQQSIKSIHYSNTPQRIYLLTTSEFLVFDSVLAQAIGCISISPPPESFWFSKNETILYIFSKNSVLSQYRLDPNLSSPETPAVAISSKSIPPIYQLVRDPLTDSICLQLQSGVLGVMDENGYEFGTTNSSISTHGSIITTYDKRSICIGTYDGDIVFMDVDNNKIYSNNVPNIGCAVKGITTAGDSLFVCGAKRKDRSRMTPDCYENKIIRFNARREAISYTSELSFSKNEELRKIVVSIPSTMVAFVYSTTIQFWDNKNDAHKAGPKKVLEIPVTDITPHQSKPGDISFLCARDKDVLIITFTKGECIVKQCYQHSNKIVLLQCISTQSIVFVDESNNLYIAPIDQLLSTTSNQQFVHFRPIEKQIKSIIPCPGDHNKKIAIITKCNNCFIFDYSDSGRLESDVYLFMKQRRLQVLSMCWVKGNIPVILTHVGQVMIFTPGFLAINCITSSTNIHQSNSHTKTISNSNMSLTKPSLNSKSFKSFDSFESLQQPSRKSLQNQENHLVDSSLESFQNIQTPIHLLPHEDYRKIQSLLLNGLGATVPINPILQCHNLSRDTIRQLSSDTTTTYLQTILTPSDYTTYNNNLSQSPSLISHYISITQQLHNPTHNEFWRILASDDISTKIKEYQQILHAPPTTISTPPKQTQPTNVPLPTTAPPPIGLYPNLFISPTTHATSESSRVSHLADADADPSTLSALQLLYDPSAAIDRYITSLPHSQNTDDALRALLAATTTFPTRREEIQTTIIDALMSARRERAAVRLLENVGARRAACLAMIQNGDVAEAVLSAVNCLPKSEMLLSFYLPWVVMHIGNGAHVTAASSLLNVGGVVDAIRVLLKGRYFELAALLVSFVVNLNVAPLDTDITVNYKILVFDSNKHQTFRELCIEVYTAYVDDLGDGLEEVKDLYKAKIETLQHE
ncbi:WD domain [Entamoeba marina]